ncbi:TonB-dependent siderophore receptor [Chromohalobacter canadensis]|uniref:TonB-dependent siderophore receptor n=1 Tax=Chromohalobacter canadensis TaxID=141389 RepID=UPI0021BF0130|nr:TonB-dependent siderophore receptor [Chromohalobacter canadensis]MCT8469889.1 TonB-dependent siderophore receptor [Chromohalobacter canadensis]MCT8471811.1 TonB-dependent siderophore receptor [Chromohalobacter canadensis]MCT8499264.1 TonB-dependent siderophore receptor [Chromohalobacter canadensis]
MATHKSTTYWAVTAVGGLVIALNASQAIAQQDQQGQDDGRLETITVEGNRLYEMLPSEVTQGYSVDAATVGTKTPASLRDIPQSVSVVTRDAIEDQNFDTLDQMAKRTPGMRVLPNDSGRSSIYSRGYEYNEYNIDGLPAPMTSITGSVPNLAAFDRVEVMRGPSGLFNSTSEMGGIINLVRKRPTEEFQGHVTGRYGSWDQNYVESDISGPINSDGSVRGRMVIANDDSNGFADYNENTNQTFYGALDIDLDEDTMLSLAYLRQHRDITPSNGVPSDSDGNLLDFSRSTFFGADWNDFNSQSNDWIAELTHRFDNGGYGRIAARYSNRSADYKYAYTFSGVDANNESSMVALGGKVKQETVSADASYSQPFDTFGNVSEFVVGTDYKRYETEMGQGVARLGTINVNTYSADQFDEPDIDYTRTNNRTTLEEYGLYSKLTFRPIQPLALIAGGRVSAYQQNLSNYLDDSSDSRSDDAKFTPYAGAVLDLNNDHSLYASYSEVFIPQSDSIDQNGQLLKPREGEQYEVGIKGSYFNGDLNARVSVFRMYDDNAAATPANGDTSYSVAVGKRRIQGGELELTGSITDQWDVIFGYTYLDTEVEDGDMPVAFMLMPHNMANLWTQYGFEGGMLDGFHFGGGITAMSDFHTSTAPSVEAPGYAVVDAMVGYDFTSHIKGQLNFNNIFDKTYYERVGSTSTFNMVGAPSNVVASLRYDF